LPRLIKIGIFAVSAAAIIAAILDPPETRPSGGLLFVFFCFFRIGEEERHGVVGTDTSFGNRWRR